MSYQAHPHQQPQSERAHHHPQSERAGRSARAQSAETVSRHLQRPRRSSDPYTLAHAGRQVRLGPVAFWIVVGTLVIMGVWTIGTGTYFAFREDVLSRLISRHARMQIAYEDRIAELRAQIDRVTSRQLLDQEQFEDKLDTLLKRQATLEQRTTALTDDFPATGSAGLKLSKEAHAAGASSPVGDAAGIADTLAHVSRSLDRVASRQTTLLDGLQQHFDAKAQRMRNVLDNLGVKPATHAGVGGPFIPVKRPRADAGRFQHQLYRVALARSQVDRYAQTLKRVPIRQPLPGELEVNSGFGVRSDPFYHRPAMHTGLDLRGDMGEPVHATADGKVTFAGWDGGYGNLVEIDHGNGLSTRFGHLSKILVKVGEHVHIGEVIGRVGSTGRSTGPHLHYETRINGEPVDPHRFLRAGIRLGSL